MVIRTAYPVLPVNKFRLQWERATRRTRGALEERCRSLRSGGPELPHGPDNALPDTLQARYDSLRFQNVAYREFEERFDRLVGLICVAAQEGITPEREAAYREQRRWFITGYSRVRPFVSGFLTPCISDRAPGLWRQRPCDAFEALFLPLRLETLLCADDGNLITRLTRTQTAVSDWYCALRQQEKSLTLRR